VTTARPAGTPADAAAAAASSAPPAPPSVPTPTTPSFPANADWKALSYPAAQCMTRDEYSLGGIGPAGWDAATVSSTSGDVTGDGLPEVLVVVNCPVPTSSHADQVVVLRAAETGPEVIGVLREDVWFSGATVTTGGSTVTLTGPSRTESDAMCCPGHHATATYRWTGSSFTLADRMEALTSQAFSYEPLADGDHVGILGGLAEDQVLIDVVEWYGGPAPQPVYANDDDLMRVLPVAGNASIRYLDWSTFDLVRVPDVSALASREDAVPGYLGVAFYRFSVADGAVTSMEEFFVS
jgi:hypothetical protein